MQEGGAGVTEGCKPAAADEAADFVLEVGTEEIPPAELTAVLQQLREKVAALLDGSRLGHGAVDVQGTPRRLTVRVAALAPRQETVTEERRGPPRARAFDDAGNPTKALLGFCRGCGADAAGVFFKADKKVRWGHLLRRAALRASWSGAAHTCCASLQPPAAPAAVSVLSCIFRTLLRAVRAVHLCSHAPESLNPALGVPGIWGLFRCGVHGPAVCPQTFGS